MGVCFTVRNAKAFVHQITSSNVSCKMNNRILGPEGLGDHQSQPCHFTGEALESQRGSGTCLRSPGSRGSDLCLSWCSQHSVMFNSTACWVRCPHQVYLWGSYLCSLYLSSLIYKNEDYESLLYHRLLGR